MKDKNGIEIKCKNCANYGTYLFMPCLLCLRKNAGFKPTVESYEARIAKLQKELTVVQESERAEAQEADRLRAEVKELKAHNEVLQRRVEEFSMELLDYNMKENKDVLERLKQAESDKYKREAIQLRKKNIELRDFLKEINRKLYIWKNEAKSLQVISTKLTEEATNKSM